MADYSPGIKEALGACAASSDFADAAKRLLAEMGYESTRTLSLPSTPNEFFEEVYKDRPKKEIASRKGIVSAAKSIKILFQLGKAEVQTSEHGRIFDEIFEGGDYDSFLFTAVELGAGKYPRREYAQFTCEINKPFSMPVVVLFRVPGEGWWGARLTLAFVGRRKHKRDESRDVLGKASLLREIACGAPHLGHLNILNQLSLKERRSWIREESKPKTFDSLLEAWLDVDTETLCPQPPLF